MSLQNGHEMASAIVFILSFILNVRVSHQNVNIGAKKHHHHPMAVDIPPHIVLFLKSNVKINWMEK